MARGVKNARKHNLAIGRGGYLQRSSVLHQNSPLWRSVLCGLSALLCMACALMLCASRVRRAPRSCLVILSGAGLSPAGVPGAAGRVFGLLVFVFVFVFA